jgi:ketosteroid isomerase-like protein
LKFQESFAMSEDEISAQILAMERAALDRWGRGDPDGFLEISAPDVVYFDPFLPQRIDGLDALRQYYSELRGTISVDSYEIVNPEVQVHGDLALLTFRLISCGGGDEIRWNTTEVYRRGDDGWRIIHSHWSFTQPELANLQA